jgi:hypothetical protein
VTEPPQGQAHAAYVLPLRLARRHDREIVRLDLGPREERQTDEARPVIEVQEPDA